MPRRLSLLPLVLLLVVTHAAEPEKLRSIAEGLTRTKGDFVFESLPKSGPSNISFDTVEVSARTEKGLRLEGTAMRSLGVSLRGWRIGPWCVREKRGGRKEILRVFLIVFDRRFFSSTSNSSSSS